MSNRVTPTQVGANDEGDTTLAWLNDTMRYNFTQIADVIESGKVVTK
jgi:hypothetical protein